MSKILLRLLTIALLVLPILGQLLSHSQASPITGNNSAQPPTKVEVMFDGLMVFARVDDHYEVGILDAATASNHEFGITVGKSTLTSAELSQHMSAGTWSLDVVSASGVRRGAQTTARQAKACNRSLDTTSREAAAHAYDFCWLMDMENEFHDGVPLELRPDRLKPIITLNNGELYSAYKSDELEIEKPLGTYKTFGFITETTGLEVTLQPGEHLVLSAGGQTVFSLPTTEGVTRAGIHNAPKPKYKKTKRQHEPHSHFLYYYRLFSNVDDDKWYDIRPKAGARRPLNRWTPPKPDPGKKHSFELHINTTSRMDDVIRMRTVDDYACGGVYMGLRTKSLTTTP